MGKTSASLAVKPFEYIYVDDEVSNIREIMLFCGVAEEDLEQELIYHEGGDAFCFSEYKDIFWAAGMYLLKTENGLLTVKKDIFQTMFSES